MWRISIASTEKSLLPFGVANKRSVLVHWLPALVWMVIIFSASSDRLSLQHSSHLLGPLVHWLFPNLEDPAVAQIIFLIRKCAHFTEYGILALLLWYALRRSRRSDPYRVRGSEPWLALGLVALYAATDEWHQSFVPSRQGSVWDVLLDTSGAACALLMVLAIRRWRRRSRGQGT